MRRTGVRARVRAARTASTTRRNLSRCPSKTTLALVLLATAETRVHRVFGGHDSIRPYSSNFYDYGIATKRDRLLQRAKRRAAQSQLLRDLRAEFDDAPEEQFVRYSKLLYFLQCVQLQ